MASIKPLAMFSKSLFACLSSRKVVYRPLRSFSTTPSNPAKNRIYTVIRNPEELSNYILLSASSRTPLITLWTSSWCPTCRTVSPILEELISSGVGEQDGGVSYAEVEYDAPDMMSSELGLQYMITKIPTLLSFDRSEAQSESKVVDGRKLVDRQFLKEWIENEARRKGNGGGGGSWAPNGSLLGALFGYNK